MKCYVCGAVDAADYYDTINGTVSEEVYRCQSCGLWEYEYAYGAGRQLIGFYESYSSWSDTSEQDCIRYDLQFAAANEATAMFECKECRPFLNAIKADKSDHAPRLIFADYLQERGLYPMQEAALRATCKVTA